jgi:hypothetical protein
MRPVADRRRAELAVEVLTATIVAEITESTLFGGCDYQLIKSLSILAQNIAAAMTTIDPTNSVARQRLCLVLFPRARFGSDNGKWG